MPAQGATKVEMGPEAAKQRATRKAGSPGRKTSTLPRHRAYASWEDENKENIDPRTQRKALDAKPKALSPTKTNTTTRARRRRNAIVPVGSPRSVCDLENAFAALAMASRR